MKKWILACAVLCAGSAAAACPVQPHNTPSKEAQKLAIYKLNGLLKCDPTDPVNDQSPCNTFASRGLEAIYQVTDFKTGSSSHMSANQIWQSVSKAGSSWVALGSLLDQDANLCAQSAANMGIPVIAVMHGNPHGHIALVIPGEPRGSSSWGINAANSASFFYMKPESAYVSKPLSNAFGRQNAQGARFYYRKH